MNNWTKRDTWLARIWPFLVLKKVDAIVDANNEVDQEAAWAARLTSSEAQQAALRISDQEVSRVERLEDKLDRQQPVAALLIPVATALLTAAWIRGYAWIVFTSAVALMAAGFALFTAARANVPFQHHTLTVPELEGILDVDVDASAIIAARAITDSQRNIPRGTSIQNRVAAVRHAIFSALIFIVISAILFAGPNWNTIDGSLDSEPAVVQAVQTLRQEVRDVAASIEAGATRDHRLRRKIARIQREIRRLQREVNR